MSHVLEYLATEMIVLVGTVILLFLINRLGFISRNSALWRIITLMVLILLDGAALLTWFTQGESPFALSITSKTSGRIDSIAIAKAPISLRLHGPRQQNGILYLLDDQDREYRVTLPAPIKVGDTVLALSPMSALRGLNFGHGGFYWISRAGDRWIVVVGDDFVLLLVFVPGTLLLWHGGTRGKPPPEVEG